MNWELLALIFLPLGFASMIYNYIRLVKLNKGKQIKISKKLKNGRKEEKRIN